MSGYASLPLQQALFARLTGDASFMTGIAGVFDYVPQGTGYPYFIINEVEAKDASNLRDKGVRVMVEVVGEAEELGRKGLLEKLERVYTLLHEQGLSVSGASSAVCHFMTQQVSLREDGLGFRGVQRYSVVVME